MNPTKMITVLFTLAVVTGPLGADEAMAPQITISARDWNEFSPVAAYNDLDDEYVVVWHDYDPGASPKRRILARRLDRYGRPLAATVTVSPVADGKDRVQPEVVFDAPGQRLLVVYMFDYNGDGSDWDIRGRFLDRNLSPLGNETTIAANVASEWAPRVAHALASPQGSRFLVTWTRLPVSGDGSVHGALVVSSVPQSEFPIAVHATQNRLNPDVAYDPWTDTFFVAYDNTLDVFGRAVSPGGTVGSEVTIANATEAETRPAIASCDNYQFAVVWNSRISPFESDVRVRFLYGDGTPYSTPTTVFGSAVDEADPDVACIGEGIDYMVTWSQQYSNSNGPYGVNGRKVRATQQMQPAFAIRAPQPSETGVAYSSHVAGGETGWLATFQEMRQLSPYYLDIRARVVWSLFADGFEWGSTSLWSAAQP